MERRFVGVTDLAEYLGLNTNTLRYWIWQRRIPFHKLGRLIRFDLKEIEAWVIKTKVKEIT